MMITNSSLYASLAIYHLISNPHSDSWNCEISLGLTSGSIQYSFYPLSIFFTQGMNKPFQLLFIVHNNPPFL